MTRHVSNEKTSPIIYFTIIILPFLFFYWMVPFVTSLSIGKDYQTTHIENQMELQFSLKKGSFPLYVPGFASGHSSSALTLGQLYHPMPYIASVMPGYWNGYALQLNTLLKLLSLGLTHIVLFFFLRTLKVNLLFSFLLSSITVYNMRMLDLFRYAASLETYTGYLLLCSSIGLYFINPARIWGPLGIIGSTYLLICSGHPQMMYYGLIGAFLFTLITPFIISVILHEKTSGLKTSLPFWLKVGGFLTLGLLLSSAYVLPFYFEFLSMNAERIGQSYIWADSIRDTLPGTLNSFFLPFRSGIHGAFGGSSIILMAALLPLLRFLKVRIPPIVWATWGIVLIVFFHMQGSRTPVHQLVWQYLPFASSFRYAGRISLVIPVFIMMMLVWVSGTESFSYRVRDRSITLVPFSALSLFSLIAIIMYLSIYLMSLFFHSPEAVKFIDIAPTGINSIPQWVEILATLCGMLSLLILFKYSMHRNTSKTLGILLCLVTFVQIVSVLRYGTFLVERDISPTFQDMKAQKVEKLDYNYYPGTGMYSSIVTTQLKHSFMEPFLGKVYTHVTPVSNIDEAYEKMQNARSPGQIFVEGYKPEMHPTVNTSGTDKNEMSTELIYSSFNRLVFRVISSEPGFFGFSYPFTGHWKAMLNGSEVRIYRANGASQAVRFNEGESLIEFQYRSNAAYWGIIISLLTLTLIGVYISFKKIGGTAGLLAASLVFLLSVVIFMLWQNSLYSGDNLGTEYKWTYEPPRSNPNLAYGKKTWISRSLRTSPGYMHSSRAVDGLIRPDSGFKTRRHDNPAWFVDLHKATELITIVLHESSEDPAVNVRPLDLDLSLDGSHWKTAASITSAPYKSNPVRIYFKSPKTARYLRIKANGLSSLSLDEVEIYGQIKTAG